MRSTFSTCCLLVVVALLAKPAWAQTDTYMEYVGSTGTANYNVASNWNQLVWDPNTSKWVLDPNVTRVPANDQGTARNETAYIRNGATVTIVNSVPNIAGLQIGVAGDVTKDSGGTILPRPGSKLEVRSGGQINLASSAGAGNPSPHATTIGASYDGTLNIAGGQFQSWGRFFVGGTGAPNPGGLIPYQGTGYLNVSSGQLTAGYYAVGTFWPIYLGYGRTGEAGKRGVGVGTITGGNVALRPDSGIVLGYNGGRGSLAVRPTDPNASVISSADAYLTVGGEGFWNSLPALGSVGYLERSEGTYIQDGGAVTVDGINVGQRHGDGLFILNGGTFTIDGENESRVGVGGGRTVLGTTYLASGVGSIVVNGGVFLYTNERTKFLIGRAAADSGDKLGPGYGVFTINGGKVEFSRAGGTVDNCLEIGHSDRPNASNQSWAYGELNVLGGSLIVNKRMVLAKRDGSTGILRVSKDAFVSLGWLGCWVDAEPIPTDHMPKIIVDVTATGHTQINVYQDLWLKGTLDVQTYGYRPREGNRFKVIELDDWLSEITGDFEVFTSNITNGLPTDPMDPNKTLSAFIGLGIPGDPNVSEPNAGYYVTFRGYTAGDANKDHKVDGSDLALLGGAWMKTTGQTWGNGDFTNDGKVDGSDLALMGGNWMWVKPPAPPLETALPEPATLVLLALGGVAMIRRRR